ncbi:MAG: hypothetical protein IPG63_17830 [Xanthomonadales bacterium]|nr:hypothetical protein [Xanthomonadales bacterium]MBK7145608.1 hypothetical protein [Xanthomonadales bacterium]MCC6561373.1 hypothetical protein [Xanthomonadales bacterium]
MKLQLQTGSARLRLDEAELTRLLAGETLVLTVAPWPGARWCLEVALGTVLSLRREPTLQLQLPRAPVETYATTLPRRDACAFALADALDLQLEIDVRDSVRVRGRGKR